MQGANRFAGYVSVLQRRPNAWAIMEGDAGHPDITGIVRFYQTRVDVLVAAEVSGLPAGPELCGGRVLGFHIHSGEQCTGDETDPFAAALGHYDPNGCPHPEHVGDMPPLFSNHGYAFQVFLTDRFSVREIIGRTVIIHSAPDDFTSQPSGNAGSKIACGRIRTR